MSNISREYIVPIILLVTFSFMLLIVLCLKNSAADEAIVSMPAYNLAFHNKLAYSLVKSEYTTLELREGVRPPLYFIILAFLFKLFGVHRWEIALLSLLPAVLYFGVVYIIARWLTKDKWSAVFSAAFLALGSNGVLLAKRHFWDALASLFFALSLLCFLLSRRYNISLRKILVVAAGVFLSLAVQTYAIFGLMFFCFVFYFFYEQRPYPTSSWQEVFLFTAALALPFAIWVHYINDFHDFVRNILMFVLQERIFIALGKGYAWNNWFVVVFRGLFGNYATINFATTVLLIFGNVFFIKKFPQHRRLFIAFVFLPFAILALCNLTAYYYIALILPLAYTATGGSIVYLFRVFRKNGLQLQKRNIFIIIFLLLFAATHIISGIGARYFILIKDWRIRDLDAYEKELLRWIPPGSKVVGNGENYYALIRSGSTMYYLDYINESMLNTQPIDYIIVPTYYKPCLWLAQFIKERFEEIARIGKDAYVYQIAYCQNNSGYGSIIYKIMDTKIK